MSYRSIAARHIKAITQTRRYAYKLANGECGVLVASDDRDAQEEAKRLARVRKTTYISVSRIV